MHWLLLLLYLESQWRDTDAPQDDAIDEIVEILRDKAPRNRKVHQF
jgi:hypothetical protein